MYATEALLTVCHWSPYFQPVSIADAPVTVHISWKLQPIRTCTPVIDAPIPVTVTGTPNNSNTPPLLYQLQPQMPTLPVYYPCWSCSAASPLVPGASSTYTRTFVYLPLSNSASAATHRKLNGVSAHKDIMLQAWARNTTCSKHMTGAVILWTLKLAKPYRKSLVRPRLFSTALWHQNLILKLCRKWEELLDTSL